MTSTTLAFSQASSTTQLAHLERSLDEALAAGVRDIVLDFSEVSHLAAADIRFIASARSVLLSIGGRLHLKNIPQEAQHSLILSGLTQLLN